MVFDLVSSRQHKNHPLIKTPCLDTVMQTDGSVRITKVWAGSSQYEATLKYNGDSEITIPLNSIKKLK
jgi:hypothetical protein